MDSIACNTPIKSIEISPINKASLDKYDDHAKVKESSILNFYAELPSWIVIKLDDKMRVRINAMHFVILQLDYKNKDVNIAIKLDPLYFCFS